MIMTGSYLTATYTDLTVSQDGHVIEITLNRPDQLNAFNSHLHDELRDVFERINRDTDARVVVLTGAGKAFSAGGDFEYILKNHKDPVSRNRSGHEARGLLLALVDCPLPVVASVHGDAIGLGATVALCADVVVASPNARFADPHVGVGLTAGDGGCVLWPALMGMLRAKRYLLTADRIGAEDGYKMGIVTDLVGTPEEVLPTARKIAARIAALPPFAVQSTKRTLSAALRARVEEVFDLGINYEIQSFASPDIPEAVAAIKERRPGNYKGFVSPD
jgi:enoyl-CoA hydratase